LSTPAKAPKLEKNPERRGQTLLQTCLKPKRLTLAAYKTQCVRKRQQTSLAVEGAYSEQKHGKTLAVLALKAFQFPMCGFILSITTIQELLGVVKKHVFISQKRDCCMVLVRNHPDPSVASLDSTQSVSQKDGESNQSPYQRNFSHNQDTAFLPTNKRFCI
jgi:hypothetical protein